MERKKFNRGIKMILKMILDRGSYRKDEIFGLGNSILNYLIANKILEDKEMDDIIIEKRECLCILEDDKTIHKYDSKENKVFEILINDGDVINTKYATLPKTIEFLKNMNTIFENGVIKIHLRVCKKSEIL